MLAFGFTVIPTAFAEEATSEKLVLVEKIGKAEGTEQYLTSLGIELMDAIKPYAAKMPAAASVAFSSSMSEQFDGDRLYESYVVAMMSQILKADLVAVMPWYESATGKKISELLSQSSSVEAAASLRTYEAGLRAKPPSPARAKVIQELEHATQTSDLMVDITVNASAGILAGIAVAKKETSRAKQSAMKLQLAELRKKVRPQFRKSTFVFFLHTYRDATDAQLRQFIDFLGTKSGHALNSARYYALDEALKKAARSVGAAVGSAGTAKPSN